ncbi:hypothetical protein ACFT0G_04920 [Streptomyces sp. NPDC057020]|uniref:hypothetical protein n=1 Tax=unclassified Streptomyces TaxID=2593676 RepID=UPI00363C4FEB
MCAVALAAGTLTVPELMSPATAVAADCVDSTNVYALETEPGTARKDLSPRTLRKYVDFDPQGGGANGPLLRTEYTATVPYGTKVVSLGGGQFYLFSKTGVRLYRDATAEGGSLLTFVAEYNTDPAVWMGYEKIFAVSGRLWTIDKNGLLKGFMDGRVLLGKRTFNPAPGMPSETDPLVKEIRDAWDVWSAGGRVYTLTSGTVKEYAPTGLFGSGPLTSKVRATGLADAFQAWGPGRGTVYTVTRPADHSGIVRGYTGDDALASSNPDVMSGLYVEEVLSETPNCLAPASDGKPVVGAPVDDSDVSPAPVEPETDAGAEGPQVVSGVFTLGDGEPAAGMGVLIEAVDPTAQAAGGSPLPALGTAVTAADGSWSFTLPDELPGPVDAMAAENGGALNVTATAAGTTSAGVPMIGVDYNTAAPAGQGGDSRISAFGVAAGGERHTTQLIPAAVPGAAFRVPTAGQEASTYAAQEAASSVGPERPSPVWQADNGILGENHNPYLVEGVDVRSDRVMPYASGTCYTLKSFVASQIAYTVVAEGHAHWDTYATVDYDSKLSTAVDVAVSAGGNWKGSGSVSLGSSTGQATGFTSQGPYFGRELQVPIQYNKYKHTYYCGGIAKSSYQSISAARYSIPPGGPVAKLGRDVRWKDGASKFNASPKANRAYIIPGGYFQLAKGKSSKFAGAVSAFGVSLGATTTYDREHKQRITAGKRTNARHDIWGQKDRLSGNPGLFFSF